MVPRNYNCQRILQYLIAETDSGHLCPTQREIADALYISRSTVQRCLIDLDEMGLISYTPGKARTLIIRKRPSEHSFII